MRVLQRALYRFYERRLLRDVARGPMPRHLGLIQDGHRRYAREAGLSNLGGYRLGATKAEEVLTWCAEQRIPMVTLWSLSTENLSREAVAMASVTFPVLKKNGAAAVGEPTRQAVTSESAATSR